MTKQNRKPIFNRAILANWIISCAEQFHAEQFLKGFSGYLKTNEYQRYNTLPGIKRYSFWAHTTRYFIYAVPKGKKYDGNILEMAGAAKTSQANNLNENAIRSFAAEQKNWLFSTSPKETTASIYLWCKQYLS